MRGPWGLFSLGLLLPLVLPAATLAPVFSDGMVLQAKRPVPIWGEGDVGEAIVVEFAGQIHRTTVTEQGGWRVTLRPLDYGPGHAPQRLMVRGANEIILQDVLVGEVWLSVAPPDLRSWLEQRLGPGSVDTWSGGGSALTTDPQLRVRVSGPALPEAGWQPYDSKSGAVASVLGGFFARELWAQVGVPIGLIDLGAAGATVAAYLPAHDITPAEARPDGNESGSRDRVAAPGQLYQERVQPLAPFAVRGVLWSHGEADLPEADRYAQRLTALIARWRADFEDLELPFLLTRSPGGPGDEARRELQSAQDRVAGEVLGVSLAVAADLGLGGDGGVARPYELAERLGRLARTQVYDQRVPGARLVRRSGVWVDRDRVLVNFTHADGGLVLSQSRLDGFEVLDEAGTPVAVEAEIVGPRTVALTVPETVVPTGVRYGWTPGFNASLRNAYGQPAVPFDMILGGPARTDPERWARTIEVFTQQDAQRLPPAGSVLFIGSSSIRGWYSLRRDFESLQPINRGFGGSLATDCVHYFEEIVQPYQPRTIVFYAGENDIAMGRSPEDVLAAFRAFCEKAHAALPQTRVIFVAVKPSPLRWKRWPDMQEANRLVAAYCQDDPRRTFADTSTPLLDASGTVRPELFFDDDLHMNPEGYRLWVAALTPLLP